MAEGQKGLYYITGGPESLLRTSPLLEIYKKKGIEVLILDDDIDEIVFGGIDKYGEIDLKSVNKAATSDDSQIRRPNPSRPRALKPLLDQLKSTLGDRVKDVRASVRLADSPSCIVSDEEEPSIQMQQMLTRHGPERTARAQSRRSRSTPTTRSSKSSSPDPTTPSSKTPPGSSSTRPSSWKVVPLKDPAGFVSASTASSTCPFNRFGLSCQRQGSPTPQRSVALLRALCVTLWLQPYLFTAVETRPSPPLTSHLRACA